MDVSQEVELRLAGARQNRGIGRRRESERVGSGTETRCEAVYPDLREFEQVPIYIQPGRQLYSR